MHLGHPEPLSKDAQVTGIHNSGRYLGTGSSAAGSRIGGCTPPPSADRRELHIVARKTLAVCSPTSPGKPSWNCSAFASAHAERSGLQPS